MGHGYQWTSALEICASYGFVMSFILAGLAVLLYWKHRRINILFITVALLTIGLLGESSWLLYRGSFSPGRTTLDRVDHGIMYIVDRERRVRFFIDRRYKPVEEVPAERLKDALDLAQQYLGELKRPVVAAEDLEFLHKEFQVRTTPILGLDRRVLLGVACQLGLITAIASLLLTVCYLASRFYCSPKRAANIGCFGTLVVFVGFLLTLPVLHPLYLLLLLILAIAALVLYLSCRRESPILLEIAGGANLVLAAAIFALASHGYEFYGENDIRRKVIAMDQRLPRIQAVAQALEEALDSLPESLDRPLGLEDAVSELWTLAYNLFITVGGLEEKLGNADETADSMDGYRKFDPYKEEFKLFREAPFRKSPSQSEIKDRLRFSD